MLLIFIIALLAVAVVASALIVRRAVVAEFRRPTRNRVILPMSTGVPILPTQSAQITGRPQCGFRPQHLYISNACTEGGAADWIVNEIKMGNRSQLIQSGDLPGDMFAPNAVDAEIAFDAVDAGADVMIVVTYIGLNQSGSPFFASFVGERTSPAVTPKVKLHLVSDERKSAA